ncbi:dihydroxy-butanone phosphate synthase [Zalerion maritima]|uniref:3,4-dihydroxy-2-butanone 4-phosphate synthase n=1 Tax=Zalerion maritima TaxID=339359 RepID=A0AAD5RRA8_9PEZI|nr:dihydroxy-butanone phosphate synthase [Zalerion maritima]
MPASTTLLDESNFDSIPDTIKAFRDGKFIVVLDDPTRENEGDLIISAKSITPNQMAFMVRHSSGYVCAPLAPQICDRLHLPPMVSRSQDPRCTAYTVSVDASHPSVTTGISAHDRAFACRTLANPGAKAEDLRRPGHVLPLKAKQGGVRERRGHTEAAIDFCRLAGHEEAAVICELVDDGTPSPDKAEHENPGMLRGEGCLAFSRKWGLKVCTIADLVAYLEKHDAKQDSVNGTS